MSQGQHARSGCEDDELSRSETATFLGHRDQVLAVCLSRDGQLALSASRDRTLRVWDVAAGTCRAILTEHGDAVTSVCLVPGDSRVLSGSADGTVRCWDVAGGDQSGRRVCDVGTPVTGVACGADGRTVLVTSIDGGLTVWDVITSRRVRTLRWLRTRLTRCLSRRAEVAARRELARDGYRFPAALSAAGRRAYSADPDTGALTRWDLGTGHRLGMPGAHEGGATAVAVSADGSLLVSGGRDRLVRAWDVASGQCLQTFAGHADWVLTACPSADGRYVLSGSADRSMRLWETATGRCLAAVNGHRDWVRAVCLSADGTVALSGSADGSVRCCRLR